MSTQGVQILEGNFADFVRDQKEEDYFSKKIKELYEQLSDPTESMSADKKKEIEVLLSFVDNPENLEKLLDFSKKFISLKNNINQSNKIFDNLLPYGSNDHVSDFLTVTSANTSSEKFAELGTKLFPDTFNKERLKHGFMSLFLFPTINTESFGLHDVELLRTLFQDLFINSLTSSNITIAEFIRNYFKAENIFKINIDKIGKLIPNIKDHDKKVFSDNEFFKFDCKLWYESFDEKMSNSNKSKIAVVLDKPNSSDSYGQFVSLPDLKEGKPNILGTYHRGQRTYDFTLLPNMRKRCFVIPKISIERGTEVELFKEATNLANTSDYSKNLGFLLFYNFIKYSSQPDIVVKEDSTTKGKTISSTYALYTDNFSIMEGGSKKNKMIGGSHTDLFDKKSEPFLLLKRDKYVYDKNNFYECLQKLRKTYKLSDFKKQIKSFQDIIDQVKNKSAPILFPVVYSQGNNLKLGTFELTYEQLRLIFHFSYVYTTFIKLLLFFFRNLIKIYQTFVMYFESEIKTGNKSKPLYEQRIQFYEENIKKFSILISEIAKLIQILELTISCGEDQTNNFFGFNTTFYKKFIKSGDSQNKINQAKKMQTNFIDSIIELLFEGIIHTPSNTPGSDPDISINSNQFMKLLQKLSGIFPINFGGVPLIDLPKTQNSFLVSYSYFIKFRYVCQRNFTQFKKFYNIAEKQKLTNQEIKNITNDVNREVQKIINNKSPSLKDKCKKIFKNVLEIFMQTLADMAPKTQSATSSQPTVHNNTSGEKDLSKKLTEFKVYIAAIEKSLDTLIIAESKAAMKRGERLFVDPTTLFLFMMGRFNHFIYLLEYCQLKPTLPIELSKYFRIEDLETVYKTFENLFFNTKPQYPTSLKDILSNNREFTQNPLASNPQWWAEKEQEFKKTHGESSRLFMLCIRKNAIGSDLVLVDPFSCSLTPSGEKILQKKFLDLSYTYNKNGKGKKIVDMRYSPSNNAIINLTPSLRTIRQLWSRAKSKNIKEGTKPSPSISANFFTQVNKIPNSVSTNNKTRNNPITTMKNVMRLLRGLLKDEFGRNIKPVILQGRNQRQLLEIIARNMLHQKNDNKDNEYQLIQFSSSDFENSDNFRMTLSKVLFSPPQTCFDERSALDHNLFTQIYQKPVSSKTFLNKIRLGDFGLGGLVKDFFSAIEPDDITKMRKSLNDAIYSSKSLVEKNILIFGEATEVLRIGHNLINQQDLQELLRLKESNYYAIKSKPSSVSTGSIKSNKSNTRLGMIGNNSELPNISSAGVSALGSSFPRRAQFSHLSSPEPSSFNQSRRGAPYLGSHSEPYSPSPSPQPSLRFKNTTQELQEYLDDARSKLANRGYTSSPTFSSQRSEIPIMRSLVPNSSRTLRAVPAVRGHVSKLAQSQPSFPSQNTIKEEITRQPFYRLMHTYLKDISKIGYPNPVIQFFPFNGEIRDDRVIVAFFYKEKGVPIFVIFYDTQRNLFGFEDLSKQIKTITGYITEHKVEGTVTYFCKYLSEYLYIFELDMIGSRGEKYFVSRRSLKQPKEGETVISCLLIGSNNFYDFYEFYSNNE
jgi:hypothetical protein